MTILEANTYGYNTPKIVTPYPKIYPRFIPKMPANVAKA